MDFLFTSVLETTTELATPNIASTGFLMCTVASLVLGLACALVVLAVRTSVKKD